jgi:hypothetical protein
MARRTVGVSVIAHNSLLCVVVTKSLGKLVATSSHFGALNWGDRRLRISRVRILPIALLAKTRDREHCKSSCWSDVKVWCTVEEPGILRYLGQVKQGNDG